ncbi:alpha-1,4-glucan branching enzyme [Scheffersomyces spartinae]|uniref:1,4-alpha-glucan-branching enzyme n=1 Tax=Scheffersomyces spartinae TaxID=45513 RepID=A0A9P7V4W7_9ASCO|nr:alpha-1,4-glucan branching enzyme [Scheffersomyces spartinae]KAG7191391.1 alpha-1,4-glucan branching enzyme [Scheffersomyces spartinae]
MITKQLYQLTNMTDHKSLIKGALDIDPWLEPYSSGLIDRQIKFRDWLKRINEGEGSLSKFASSYETYGLVADPATKRITVTQYIPDVQLVSLVGDFNNWNAESHQLKKVNDYGLWSLTLEPTDEGNYAIEHNSKYKISMLLPSGERIYRLDPWCHRTIPEPKAHVYDGRFWNPEQSYQFKYKRPKMHEEGIKIYEAHVGISTPEPKIGTYKNFTENILPVIHKLGYNTIQLMAVMEHAYYASFGYQVTNFFACSSRYGTPEELKELIDTAHKYGIRVLLDVVHSHSSKNVDDGLNMFNGTDHYLFHGGGKGNHDLWDSRLFNYLNYETLRFLLSNLKYYVDVFKFDGFRFDGVTSMLYKHHGLSFGFSGDYNEYFNPEWVDDEAITYMMLAHELLDEIAKREDAQFTSIAEDVSGMPTLCLPIAKGGIGFDYRLSMAIPDMWIKILKHLQDEAWDLGNIVFTLTNRRHGEKCISYVESHDQALVGDKTVAFWLMDKEMYTNMSILSENTPIIDRGIQLHKLIRLLTFSLGGEGYLNFEGNEFGHPEWLDFPREGNGESYHYARRQFNLIEDDLLRYKFLFAFDSAMQHLDSKYNVLDTPQAYISLKHEIDKVVVFERNGLLFIFNLHPNDSFPDYKVGVETPGCYQIVLNSDREEFGGHNRIQEADSNGKPIEYFTNDDPWNNRANSLFVYIPSRCALVLQLKDKIKN